MSRQVAIIGFSFRLPGTHPDQCWEDLLNGHDLVTEVHPQRWDQRTFLHPNKQHPGSSYTFAAGSIGDALGFDAAFFGISPREAALMDPQQRLLLELAWEAIENAGVRAESLRGSDCGVYIGISGSDYAQRLVEDLGALDSTVATGNTSSLAANRLSYVLDLHGPSMPIDTACSSSLVAFHQAYRAISTGECSQALTGGVSLHFHPFGFIAFSKATMLSPKGRCKVFDAEGDGYVRSEGGGIFLLKNLEQALADGDPILAVVANTKVNTDGHKQGLTIPNRAAQVALMEDAYREIGISPVEIDYLEAHGTGTLVGDPIETRAIGEALGQHRPRNQPLPIGSIKGNLGHLESASGVAGLVKVLFCLRHRMVPANIHYETPNPHILFDEWNIQVVDKNRPLKPEGRLIIGINSFGFGGANAHVILTSPDRLDFGHATHGKLLIKTPLPVVVSAREPAALRDAARGMANALATLPAGHFYDFAYSAAFRRDHHPWSVVAFGSSPAQAAQDLASFAAEGADPMPLSLESGLALANASGPAFIYSGNGSQWEGMGRQLLENPRFREAVHEVDKHFHPLAGFSLADELAEPHRSGRYALTEIAQPALFAIQVGLTHMLRERGINPTAVCGHSVGEVAAAWAAGALTLKSAVAVIFHRSRLQGTTKGRGQMTAVGLGQDETRDLLEELGLGETLVIAGINSHRGITLAGAPVDLDQFEARLTARQVFFRRLDLDYAFHSPAMDPIEAEIRQALASLTPAGGKLPLFSTVTGGKLHGSRLNATYWWRNIREPVLFEAAIKAILAEGINCFIEIGPHFVLQSYLNDCLKDQGSEGRVVRTLARDDDSPERIWATVAQAMACGIPCDWTGYFPERGQFVALPNYPWQREHLEHPITPEALGVLQRTRIHPLLGCQLPQHEMTWENLLDTSIQPLYGDHVIGEATVFPGTGFVELAIAAAQAWHPGEFTEIEDLELRLPLVLNDKKSKVVRVAIDPRDGNLSVKGREHCNREPWGLHAVCRVLLEPRGRALRLMAPPIPDRPPDFTGTDQERLTRTLGLHYGPAFRAVNHGWVQGNTVIARFDLPDAVESELPDIHLHPALLDNTFQLLIHIMPAEIAHQEGIAFIPSRIGQVCFRATKVRPALALARLLRGSPHSLLAEFAVFGEDGTPIATIGEGRFRSVRLHRVAADALRFLDYHGSPRPHPLTPPAAPVIAPGSLRDMLREIVGRCALKGTYRRYTDEVEPLLDSLCSGFGMEALRRMAGADGTLSATWNKYLDMAPFGDFVLGIVREDHDLELLEGAWRCLGRDEELVSAAEIWNGMVGDYPEFFPLIHAVGRVGLRLDDLFHGRATLEQVLPSEGTRPALIRHVLGTSAPREIGSVLRSLISQGLGKLASGQRLGILEVSQGLPLFAHDIGISVDFRRCDYRFVSNSSATLEEADRLREHHAGMEVSHLAATGPEGGASYQIAVCTLDFDRLEQANDALDYVRGQMAYGGSLILVGCHGARWLDFCAGGPSQGLHGGPDLHAAPRQIGPQFWRGRLVELGFEHCEIFEFAPETLVGPYLLTGYLEHKVPDVIANATAPQDWLFLADASGDSQNLAEILCQALGRKGHRVQFCHDHTCEGIARTLEVMRVNQGPVAGILHLAGLSLTAEEYDAGASFEMAVMRDVVAANLVQACEHTHTDALCWLITVGAATHLIPTREGQPPLAGFSPDASLWGLGRTLMNEATNYAIRLIDLEWGTRPADVLPALMRELMEPDGEQEIVLTVMGDRFAPRLGLEPHPVATAGLTVEDPTIRLGFQFPGQLRNLRWEEGPRITPGLGEVEVQIRATGLNFRDVMYALGMLSDDAIENGFAGPTLGLEFAGEILRTGPDVDDIGVGDRVVGFGPSSFGNRLVVSTSVLSPIPPGISFEAAATIPTTFFTAYYAMHYLAKLQPGERILIHGAAGGVGIAAIQIAKWIGVEIYATAGSEEKRDFLRLLGIKHIFDSRSLDFAEEILAETDGIGMDAILNSLAGEAMLRSIRILRPFGRFLELGKRDFYENTQLGLRPFRNNISYFGIDADQLLKERPDLTRLLFNEMMALFRDGILHPLPYHHFDALDIIDAFRYMQQAKQIGKIVVTYGQGFPKGYPKHPLKSERLALSSEGTYLVTGGLRGFGLKTAEWLAAKGARNLVLISRGGPEDPEARQSITDLKGRGVRVIARACDVTDSYALEELLTEVRATLPPLRGVVHAAVVFEDGLIRNMDEGQIVRVMAPKLLGALHLDRLTRKDPIEYFVLFSSGTTLFGNPGQGNYVAANYGIENLARFRRAHGLPATAVLWGAIEDAGFLARNQAVKTALQGRMGTSAIPSDLALDVLEDMLVADRSGLGVMEINWRALARFLPSASSPKFSELARHAGGWDANDDDCLESQDIHHLLEELSDDELRTTFMEMIRVEVSEILRISPEKIDPRRSIYDMGLDSLMGIELIVAMESRFGIRLPVMALSESPTIERLAERILLHLRGTDEHQAPSYEDITSQLQLATRQHGINLVVTEELASSLAKNIQSTKSHITSLGN